MTDRRTFRLISPSVRAAACRAIAEAPEGYLCEIKEPTRSRLQNAKMWAMLGDLAKQIDWYGLKLSSDDWKDVLSASLRKELRTVPNVDGTGLVILGMRTSQMSVGQMNELIAFMDAFGSQRGVQWSEPKE